MAASIWVERRLRVPRSVFCESVGVEGLELKTLESDPTERSLGKDSRAESASFLSCEGDMGSGVRMGWPISGLVVGCTVIVVAVPELRFDGVRHCA